MVSKKNLYQSKHPFHVNAFEALSCKSWRPVETIRISNGAMSLSFSDPKFTFSEKVPFVNVRVKSRPATISDCTFFLRPGVDISILSNSENDTKQDPVWLDCRVSSVARKPHEEDGCLCEFYVNLYTSQAGLGSFRESLCKDIVSVGIDRIRILQRLGPSGYDMNGSEDIALRQKTKLFIGRFLADTTWLVVASSVKKVDFEVRSVNGKLVFGIVEDGEDGYGDNGLSFRVEGGVSVPIVVEIPSEDSDSDGDVAVEEGEACSTPISFSGLRRSKRRNVQPDRFLGCDSGSEIDIGYIRERPVRFDRGQEDDGMDMTLSSYVSSVEGKTRKSHKRKSPIKIEEIEEEEEKTEPESEKEKKNPKSKKPRLNETPIADSMDQKYYRVNPRNPKELRRDDLDEITPQFYYYPNNDTTKNQKESGCDLENFELQTKWSTKPIVNRPARKMRYSFNRYNSSGERTYTKRSLHAGAYTDMINEFLKNIDCTIKNKEEPDITAQWKERTQNNNPIGGFEPPPEEPEEEMSETDMLWQECELALASLYVLDENQGLNVHNEKPAVENCKHEYVMNDELGILCDICGDVITGIRDITSPFVQNTTWNSEDRRSSEDFERGSNGSAKFDYTKHGAPDEQLSEDKENVWALIPEIKNKLHAHQKKAFEFLWQNIAGSLKPEAMESVSQKKTGGCVISHTPGAGKTFLIIAFLVSYLKLFPGKRPLILAPKTTLYTWYKEFIKWKIPVPVYLIHGRRTYKVFKQSSMVTAPGVPKPTGDVKHILDCLEKIQKWHSQPSVLVMGYTSFLSLMREDSKFEHRKFMAKVMRESPGLMVLDEGHNPRSTKSRLRKALMKVETDLRILLSGTVFQNNFCEYFNTLCLARPKFVNEVLKSLDPKYDTKRKSLATIENRARKLFIDTIAKKIDSSEGSERKQGLKMLKKITNKFIDAYEAGGSDGLPGLQIYTILMNSTESQHDILVNLHRVMSTCNGYPLELELLITLASIHPWLVRTTPCSSKFFSEPELLELDKVKHDLRRGSKVKFVLNLVYRVVKDEKILIFCHNIAPVRLFAELFERVFGWKTGNEVLVLTGDLELFERGRVMDKFEEPNGPSRVLLASITACAEGISLTAASRVIMLDSEWNPSKTKQAIARAFRPGQRKVVYVYQLLATGTLEEDKYRRTTWKEWVSNMIFSEDFVEDPSRWQEQKIEDDVLREMVNEDKTKSFHMIMKNEKASTVIRTDQRG